MYNVAEDREVIWRALDESQPVCETALITIPHYTILHNQVMCKPDITMVGGETM
jgi:hypothetical protein